MNIAETMTPGPICLPADTTLTELARTMRKCDVGCVLLREEDRLVGLVTDRDLVVRGIAGNLDLTVATAADVMTEDLRTASPDMDITEAATIMKRFKIRRLPVLDDDTLVGIVTLGDVAVHMSGNEAMCGEILEEVSVPIGPKCEWPT